MDFDNNNNNGHTIPDQNSNNSNNTTDVNDVSDSNGNRTHRKNDVQDDDDQNDKDTSNLRVVEQEGQPANKKLLLLVESLSSFLVPDDDTHDDNVKDNNNNCDDGTDSNSDDVPPTNHNKAAKDSGNSSTINNDNSNSQGNSNDATKDNTQEDSSVGKNLKEHDHPIEKVTKMSFTTPYNNAISQNTKLKHAISWLDTMIRRRIILVVRRCKLPIVSVIGTFLWIVVRISTLSASNNNGMMKDGDVIEKIISLMFSSSSLLQLSCQIILVLEHQILYEVFSDYWIIQWFGLLLSTLLQDILGMYLLRLIYCCIYSIYHHHSRYIGNILIGTVPSNSYNRNEYISHITDTIFQFLVDNITPIRTKIQEEGEKFRINEMPSILKKDPQRIIRSHIPMEPTVPSAILTELQQYSTNENTNTYRGQISGTVYDTYNVEHIELMTNVYGLYCYSNPLHPGYWPKLNQCESEIIAMIYHLLRGPSSSAASISTTSSKDDTLTTSTAKSSSSPSNNDAPTSSSSPIGCVTSGGTESILLSIRAHCIYYGVKRGIRYPELICSSSAHAAVDKACELYNIRKVVIEANEGNAYQLQPNTVRNYITSNTIMIYASAPSYPHGVIDPIEELSKVAVEYNIGLHVDACLGGFVLAFCCSDTIKSPPVFDFRNDGVTSISIDTHKYGYSTKGTSVILYRNKELRHCQYFSYPRWTGGLYHTPSFAGSRPGGLIACAWASLLSVGQTGYIERSTSIVNAAQAIGTAIRTSIPQLQLFVSDPSDLYVVVTMQASDPSQMNIYQVQDLMKHDYGWNMNSLQYPPAIHLCITLSIVPRVTDFISNLQCTIEKIIQLASSDETGKNNATTKKKKKQQGGAAGIYGTVSGVPSGPVHHLLNVFADEVLTP